MEVTVTKKWHNKSIIGGNNFSSTTINQYTVVNNGGLKSGILSSPEPTVIQFHYTNAPSIDTYNITYASTYGPFPRFLLLAYKDNDDLMELSHPPVRVMTDGVLTSVVWDLLEPMSGLIVITK